MRYALVQNGEIQQWIIWDGVSPYTPPSGMELVSEADAIGLPVKQPEVVRETLVFPFDFIDRFTLQELSDIQQSIDPLVIKFRTKIQTMVQPIDIDHEETVMGLGYMEMVGLLAPGRANEIRGL